MQSYRVAGARVEKCSVLGAVFESLLGIQGGFLEAMFKLILKDE